MHRDMSPQRLALLLEQLLTAVDALPPDIYDEIATELDAMNPAGRAQERAARRDLGMLAELIGERSQTATLPGWAKLGVLETYAAWLPSAPRSFSSPHSCHGGRHQRPHPARDHEEPL